ncbi:hypothetical protein BZA77DRAFT_13234 [Pyronema omphalodes]|nr:hypothetical protein BZA77DRAFT_13234 [Pyronema omphalodes]
MITFLVQFYFFHLFFSSSPSSSSLLPCRGLFLFFIGVWFCFLIFAMLCFAFAFAFVFFLTPDLYICFFCVACAKFSNCFSFFSFYCFFFICLSYLSKELVVEMEQMEWYRIGLQWNGMEQMVSDWIGL